MRLNVKDNMHSSFNTIFSKPVKEPSNSVTVFLLLFQSFFFLMKKNTGSTGSAGSAGFGGSLV